MKPIGKRGTHVEMIISFSIFIIFLSSIFFIIEPSIKEKGDKEIVLNSLQREILENISSNVTLTMIKIKDIYAPIESCIQFNEGGWALGEKVVVKNAADEIIASSFSYPSLKVDWVKKDKFLKIYSSLENLETISLTSSNCASPAETTDFSISSIKAEEYVFESNIIELKSNYNSSYEDLKTYLDVSLEDEFGFTFVNSTGKISIDLGKKPASRSIYSKEIPIIYMDNQSKIMAGIIRLNMW
ncbi:MAG: hypothetical protein ABIH28_01490 [archaeon]